MKDNFSKCTKKRDLITRSGAAAGKLPICRLFDQMPTISNINVKEAPSFNGSFETTPPERPACSTPVSTAVDISETESVCSQKRKREKDTFSKSDEMLKP